MSRVVRPASGAPILSEGKDLVFCSNCRHLLPYTTPVYSGFHPDQQIDVKKMYRCEAPDNLKKTNTWLEIVIKFKRSPKVINVNNTCKWYSVKIDTDNQTINEDASNRDVRHGPIEMRDDGLDYLDVDVM